MPSHLIIAALLMLTVYQPDETLRRYGAADHVWQLSTLNGVPFDAQATITFPSRNQIAGMGPCNAFTSTNATPYPWIEIGPIASTRRACPDLQAESAFFTALRAARTAVIEGNTLTLSDEETPILIFKSRD